MGKLIPRSTIQKDQICRFYMKNTNKKKYSEWSAIQKNEMEDTYPMILVNDHSIVSPLALFHFHQLDLRLFKVKYMFLIDTIYLPKQKLWWWWWWLWWMSFVIHKTYIRSNFLPIFSLQGIQFSIRNLFIKLFFHKIFKTLESFNYLNEERERRMIIFHFTSS